MRVSNEKPNGSEVRKPPPDYRPLAEIAAVNGIGRRQLWLRVRASPERFDAVQTEGGRWYLPADAQVRRERAQITPELEARVRDALRGGSKPATVARRERLAVSTVYKIRDRLAADLEKENARLKEVIEELTPKRDAIREGPETVAFHMHRAELRGIDPKDLNPQALPRLVDTRAWINTAYNQILIPIERLKEYEAKWDQQRQAVEQLPPRPG